MTRDDMARFIEDYRDGVIDERGARVLAETLRAGGGECQWVMEELALSGWIAETLDTLDEHAFVRSFLQRLYAERSEQDFTEEFGERISDLKNGRSRLGDVRKRPTVWQLLFSSGTAETGAAGFTNRRRKQPRRRALAVASAVVAACLLAVLVAAGLAFRRRAVAVIIDSSPGVVLVRGEREAPVKSGGRIQRRETLRVPVNGFAVVTRGPAGNLTLKGGAVLGFMPATTVEGASLVLESGEIVADQTVPAGGKADTMLTPHAMVRPWGRAMYTVSVTATSTRLEVTLGTVQFTRRSDAKGIQLTEGYYAVATEDAELAALPR